MTDRQAEVFMQVDGSDMLVGQLYAHDRRGTQSATFHYADSWISHRRAFAIDPALDLFSGPIQTADGHRLFGAFSDCAPDRWGRRLMDRQERGHADADQRTPRTFTEFDYLMHVRDDGRQGAIRLRYPQTEHWAAGSDGFPHLASLPQLLRASQNLQEDTDTAEDLSLLVRAGSSLGGARPKAHVIDEDGSLAIAKFPSTSDEDHSIVQWEHVAHVLARRAGITAATCRLVDVDGASSPVLIVGRFDRDSGTRVGYMSAMTALEALDNDHRTYVEIAQFLEPVSPRPGQDLGELWRRVVFGILISNTDDHLRNHGFLRRGNGWQLSPAFDLNPNPAPGVKRFSTSIDIDSGDRNSIEDALRLAPYFRLNESSARAILGQVLDAVSEWRTVARRSRISVDEIRSMAHAFENDELATARLVVGG